MSTIRISARTALLLVLVLSVPGRGWAVLPQTLNYQGRLTLVSDGSPIPDSSGNTVVFRLWDDVSVGSQVWSETWNGNVATKSGLFNVVLGSFNPLNVPFDKPYWLEVQVNGDAAPMAPRQQLTTAPYAFRAQSVNAPLSLTSSTSAVPAVYAINSASGTAVLISGTSAGNGTLAVRNGTASNQAYAILSVTNGTGATRVGVVGASDPNFANPSGPTGIYGYSTLGTGMAGFVDGLSNSSAAVRGENIRAAGYGVVAFNSAASGPAIALSATAVSSQGMAGYFQAVTGVVALGSALGVAGSGPIGIQGSAGLGPGIGALGMVSSTAGFGMQADNPGADATSGGGAALFVNGPLKTLSAIYVDTSGTGTPSAFGSITTPSGRIRFSAVKSLAAAGVYGPFPCSTSVLNANSVVLVAFLTNVATVFSTAVKVSTAGNAFTVNVASSGGVSFAGGDQMNFLIINQ